MFRRITVIPLRGREGRQSGRLRRFIDLAEGAVAMNPTATLVEFDQFTDAIFASVDGRKKEIFTE